jgi:hypothetical protein
MIRKNVKNFERPDFINDSSAITATTCKFSPVMREFNLPHLSVMFIQLHEVIGGEIIPIAGVILVPEKWGVSNWLTKTSFELETIFHE